MKKDEDGNLIPEENAEGGKAEEQTPQDGGLSIDEAAARLLGEEPAEEQEQVEGEVAAGEEETETTEEEAGEGETEEGEGDDEGKLSERAQKILEREIGKKVAKFREREEELLGRIEELERKGTDGRTETRQAVASDLLSLSADQLDAEEEKIYSMLEFCDLHPDGYEADPDNKEDRSLTKQQILEAKAQYNRRLREVPRARQMLEVRKASETVAVQEYPELRRGGKDRAVYESFVKRYPAFRGDPNGLLILGDMLAGERMRREKAEAAGKAKVVAPKARPLPGAGAGGKKPTVTAKPGAAGAYTQARMIAEGGTIEAATRLMVEREKGRR